MLNLKNKMVTIIGIQKSGVSLVELAIAQGAKVKVSDSGLIKRSKTIENFMKLGVCFQEKGHTYEFIKESDLLVLSPGVSIFSDIVQWAKKNGITVLGEIEFAYQYCIKPIIAITGSNGKTTVTHLITNLLKKSCYKVAMCGNVGIPFSKLVREEEFYDYFVVEMSSFQLESLLEFPVKSHLDLKYFRPHIALLLNVTDNHLDRHRDMQEYIEAKCKLFQNQTKEDTVFVNKDDIRYLKNSDAQIYPCDVKKFDNQNEVFVRCVAKKLNIDESMVLEVFNEFEGIKHRLEFIFTIKGVDYINDSKSTSLASGVWALQRMSKPTILLCGGRDKKLDFSRVRLDIEKNVKHLIIYGESRDKMAKALRGIVNMDIVETLEQAVHQSLAVSVKGDCVLLSPMCASFDEFINFEERGDVFRKTVYNLKGQGVY